MATFSTVRRHEVRAARWRRPRRARATCPASIRSTRAGVGAHDREPVGPAAVVERLGLVLEPGELDAPGVQLVPAGCAPAAPRPPPGRGCASRSPASSREVRRRGRRRRTARATRARSQPSARAGLGAAREAQQRRHLVDAAARGSRRGRCRRRRRRRRGTPGRPGCRRWRPRGAPSTGATSWQVGQSCLTTTTSPSSGTGADTVGGTDGTLPRPGAVVSRIPRRFRPRTESARPARRSGGAPRCATLIVTAITSLDGFVAGPGGELMGMPFDEGFNVYALERIRAAGTLLAGRQTYEEFRSYWPAVADDPAQDERQREIAREHDGLEKVVVSDSLVIEPGAPWADITRVVPRADAAATVAELTAGDGGDVLAFGSFRTWNPLLVAGLVDELHVLVGPGAARHRDAAAGGGALTDGSRPAAAPRDPAARRLVARPAPLRRPRLGLARAPPSMHHPHGWRGEGMMAGEPDRTEKITVNLGPVDLGRIDLLVQEGHFTNRTDFIRTAVRNQLTASAPAIEHTVARRTLVLGTQHFSRPELEAMRDRGEQVHIRVLGLATVADDVTPELALATIASVEVLGAFRASRRRQVGARVPHRLTAVPGGTVFRTAKLIRETLRAGTAMNGTSEAARLMRSGRLMEATSALQERLGGGLPMSAGSMPAFTMPTSTMPGGFDAGRRSMPGAHAGAGAADVRPRARHRHPRLGRRPGLPPLRPHRCPHRRTAAGDAARRHPGRRRVRRLHRDGRGGRTGRGRGRLPRAVALGERDGLLELVPPRRPGPRRRRARDDRRRDPRGDRAARRRPGARRRRRVLRRRGDGRGDGGDLPGPVLRRRGALGAPPRRRARRGLGVRGDVQPAPDGDGRRCRPPDRRARRRRPHRRGRQRRGGGAGGARRQGRAPSTSARPGAPRAGAAGRGSAGPSRAAGCSRSRGRCTAWATTGPGAAPG